MDGIANLLLAIFTTPEAPEQMPVRRRRHLPSNKFRTLRPGHQTPRWNALLKAVLPLLRRRGAKALLARELGLPRQRLHEFLMSRTAQPDAERTLQLLEWVTQVTRTASETTPAGTARTGRHAG